jgi:hypothetical protein
MLFDYRLTLQTLLLGLTYTIGPFICIRQFPGGFQNPFVSEFILMLKLGIGLLALTVVCFFIDHKVKHTNRAL